MDTYSNNNEFRLIVWGIIGLIIFVVISYILLRRSRDRCIKEFEGYHVQVIMVPEQMVDPAAPKNSYSGVLEVPIQAGNGFEINYDLEAIENLPQLFSYLKTAEHYTGNMKYSKVINSIHNRLTETGRLDLETQHTIDPFEPPPEASYKVYQQDLERLLAIVRFFDELPEIEMKARLAAMEKFFHPGVFRRTSRRITNFLSFAWDRVRQIVSMITGYFAKGRTAEIQTITTEAQTAAFAHTPRKFEALLENSIGYLVKVKVISPDGRIRLYRGILKEYSDNYVCLYNVFYRLPRAAEYEGCNFLGFDRNVMLNVRGRPVTRDQDFEVSCDKSTLNLKNISSHHLFMEKVVTDGQEIPGLMGHFKPDEIRTIDLPSPANKVRLEYEEAFQSDIVLPRRLAIIRGRAEPRILKLERLRKLAEKVKKVPRSNIKNIESKFFAINESPQISSIEDEEMAQIPQAHPPERGE